MDNGSEIGIQRTRQGNRARLLLMGEPMNVRVRLSVSVQVPVLSLVMLVMDEGRRRTIEMKRVSFVAQ